MAAKWHIFVDNQLSPDLAEWIEKTFEIAATHISNVRPRIKQDHERVRAAGVPRGVILSKDDDFVLLVRARSSPPDLIWLRCGNRADSKLKAILVAKLPRALDLIKSGERVVEIIDPDDRTPRRRPRR